MSRKTTGPGEADALTRNPHGKLTDSYNKKIIIKNNSSKAFIQILSFAWEIKLTLAKLSYGGLSHTYVRGSWHGVSSRYGKIIMVLKEAVLKIL